MNEHNISDKTSLNESVDDDVYSWLLLLLLYSVVHFVYRLFARQDRVDSALHEEEHANVMENMGTFESLKDQCVPKDPVPLRRAPLFQRAASYGLDVDEQSASVLCGDLDGTEDLTTRELRKLQKMRSFKEWCVKNKMDSAALQDVFSRVHLYKKLKEIHPTSFWSLCSESSLISVDVVAPGVLVSLAEYLVSRVIDCGVACGLYWYASSGPGIATIILGVCLYYLFIRCWLRGRSSGAPLFSAWYETSHLSEQYRTTSGMLRTTLANILEDIFVFGTLGTGVFLSMYTRCFSESKQTVGEKIAGVTVIVEKTQRLDINE